MNRSPIAKGVIPELDGLRGIAILLVMLHRFWPRTAVGTAADVVGAGWIGVDLFFVISGFLITGILLETRGEPGYFKNFYARRMLRIFPLFYLFVAGVWLAFGRNPEFREHAGSPLWYFFHLGNVPEGVLGLDVPYWLAPLWSLAIEEQFYLTFPVVAYLLDRRRLALALIALIAIAPVIRLIMVLEYPDPERVQYLVTFCRLDTIAAGCLLAVILRAIDVERWRAHLQWLCAVVIPMAVMVAIASNLDRTSPFDRVLGYSVVAAGCAGVLALVVLARGGRSTAFLRFAPLRYFGKLCFGLYVLHRPADTLVSAVASRFHIDHDLWILPAKIVVALALATISWRLLEQPFLALKDRFRSERHPAPEAERAATPWPARLLRLLGLASVVLALSCTSKVTVIDDDAAAPSDARGDAPGDVSDAVDANPDAAVPVGTVLYIEGARHSPITPAIAARLQEIAGGQPHVFAKVGDSITVAADFLYCFDGGTVDLGGHSELAPTIAYFAAGNAAGSSPFARDSYAAVGGTTANDALTGDPSPFAREVTAIAPQLAVVMFGTNELRFGWSYAQAASNLWALVDAAIARGVVPILSTVPPNPGDPDADARVPTYNRMIRALAQGRGLPLVDLHRELELLPGRGMSSDQLHPSTAPGGGCLLTAAGLQYGYNVRNLITLEAITRTHAALDHHAPDAAAPLRTGTGTAADPVIGTLPLVDLGDTRTGELASTASSCGGASSGHEVVYELALAEATAVDAYVIDRDGVEIDVHLLGAGTCAGSGVGQAHGTIGPGTARIVVDAATAGADGEFLLVVQPS